MQVQEPHPLLPTLRLQLGVDSATVMRRVPLQLLVSSNGAFECVDDELELSAVVRLRSVALTVDDHRTPVTGHAAAHPHLRGEEGERPVSDGDVREACDCEACDGV